jgi:spore germination protein KC
MFILCTILIVGCWNRRELNDLAVSVAMGIDKQGKQIVLSDQVLIPQAISGKEGGASFIAPVVLFQTRGYGIQETARKMTKRSTRKIYVGQLQILILGEELAKEGLAKVLDHITRDHEYRKDFYVAVARGSKAQDILEVFTALEKTPATKLKSALDVSSKVWGETSAIKIDDLISAVISKGKEAVLTGITLEGNRSFINKKQNAEKIAAPVKQIFSNLAVFKKDKLVGWLNEQESIGYNYTQKNIKSTSVLLTCPNDSNKKITVEILRTKNDTKVVMKDGKPVIHLNIKTEGVISDAQCNMDFTKPSSISQVEQLTNNKIQKSISMSVHTLQRQYKSDIFGFGEEVERKSPKYWEDVKNNWNEVFSGIQVNIQVESQIRQMFKTSKSFSERMEE